MGNSSDLLENSLADVKTSIEKYPDSQTTRRAVRETLDAVLEETKGVGRFTPQDFMSLMQTVIIAVGYTRGGVTNISILNELAASVPPQLGVESLFPEVREDGRRGLWLVGSAVAEAGMYAQVMGESHALNVLGQYGRYAYFVAGVFPDILLANERKKGIGISYFDRWGSAAFDMASRQRVVSGTDEQKVFRELAANFSGYRRMLNVAGGLVGTHARRTVEREIVESYLTAQQGNLKGISNPFGLPIYDPKQELF
ncbi:hypothetical protein HYY73_03205 [Candidatus Woesearchaeota archaeon]|nr:hypothetical protein [Candidatus Woesearchaeota archaeon]